MWGRLDAASRIVNMLLDGSRAREIQSRTGQEACQAYAESLLEDADDEQRWLIAEALDDEECPPGADLAARLLASLEKDLASGEPELTRTLFIRTAQLEILREELPQLVAQAKQDEAKGSSPNVLGLGTPEDLATPDGMMAAITALRSGDALPARLGLGAPVEEASTLAVRTIARSGLVSLAVLRDGVPFGKPLQILRALLLPVSGVVAQHVWNRAAVALAFIASAWFLAGRTVTTNTTAVADLAKLSIPELLATLVAVLVVIGTAAVPIYRLVHGKKSGRAIQCVWAVLLIGTGFLATILIAATGPLNVSQLIVQPGAKAISTLLLAPTALLVLGIVLVPLPLVGPLLTNLAGRAWAGGTSWALALLAAGSIIGWSQAPLRHAISHGEDWQTATALVAVAGAPLVAVAFLLLRDPIARLIAKD